MSGALHERLYRCPWGRHWLIVGERIAIANFEGVNPAGQSADASHLLRQVMAMPGASGALRQCCMNWRLHSRALWHLDDGALARLLADQVRKGMLAVALVPDHAIEAGQFDGLEKSQATVLKALREAAQAGPGQAGRRALLPSIAPSQKKRKAVEAARTEGQAAAMPASATAELTASEIQAMPLEDRFIEVLHRTTQGDLLSDEAKQQLEAILEPSAIATTVAVLAVWAASHAIGIGFFVDLLILVAGVYSVGTAAIDGLIKFAEFLSLTRNARQSADFDKAARILAAAIAVLGVAVISRMIAKGAGGVRGAAKKPEVPKNKGSTTRSIKPQEGVEARPKDSKKRTDSNENDATPAKVSQSSMDEAKNIGAKKPHAAQPGSTSTGPRTKLTPKIKKQLEKRGWNESDIDHVVGNPSHKSPAQNKASGNSATAYFDKDGAYVVVDDVTKEVVQISDKFDLNWVPDPTILNPWKP